ncbi:ABC-type polysaccharide/polyol phosphate export permease [Pseudobutyrivibrio sp. C4]|uniref:ABC transporter permease n=1 Tax=Pseudobutyrivibrio sp. C4 TaxID=1520803 RepID=UPI0008D74242|nr:ABC transporter permease [Pseudobutyrivibrio sp. C4]SET25320.1 ABC-type polysaccharide/polyol phosphate export permease [Pseudobutyrivibrio sp. C4]
MKKSVFHISKWIISACFILFVAVCALFPVKNQPVTLVVDTGVEVSELTVSVEDLSKIDSLTMIMPGIGEKSVREVRFHRGLKSISVDKISSGELEIYMEVQDNQIIFNSAVVEKMQKLSKTALLERLFTAECGLCVALFLWIILNALEEKFDESGLDNHGPINEITRFFKDIRIYKEYILFAAKSDLNAEVANSYLNRLWWILEPFFNMLVYVVVFGKVMGNSIQNYATFIFSALLMWNYFNHIINYSVKCVRFNRDIVTKIYVPKYVLLLTNMVLNFIKLLFSCVVLVVMLLIFKVHIGIEILYCIPAYVLMLILSFGVGMVLLHFGVFVDDLSYAVSILLQMAMFLTGIFFDVVTALTAPLNSVMLCLNPCTVFIDSMRNALLYRTISNVPLVCVWIVLALMISYIGIHIVFKHENSYVKVI